MRRPTRRSIPRGCRFHPRCPLVRDGRAEAMGVSGACLGRGRRAGHDRRGPRRGLPRRGGRGGHTVRLGLAARRRRPDRSGPRIRRRVVVCADRNAEGAGWRQREMVSSGSTTSRSGTRGSGSASRGNHATGTPGLPDELDRAGGPVQHEAVAEVVVPVGRPLGSPREDGRMEDIGSVRSRGKVEPCLLAQLPGGGVTRRLAGLDVATGCAPAQHAVTHEQHRPRGTVERPGGGTEVPGGVF